MSPTNTCPNRGSNLKRTYHINKDLHFKSDIFPLSALKQPTFNENWTRIINWDIVEDEWETFCPDEVLMTSDLGKGTYGNVTCVHHKPTGQLFAKKSISKRVVCDYGVNFQIENEVQFQIAANHVNVLRCYSCTEDSTHLHLYMDFCSKGDLYKRLRSRPERRFAEEEAFYYFMQLVNGVSYIHSIHYYHRDLKLENILIDSNETLKIADFGWIGSIIGHCESFNFCGTIDYLSPEMICGTGHDWRIDIWTLGVLLFEMLTGSPPFHSFNSHQLVQNILTNKPIYPKMPSDTKQFISKLLTTNPEHRLRLVDVVNDPWVKRCWNRHIMKIIYNIKIEFEPHKEEEVKRRQTSYQPSRQLTTPTTIKPQTYSHRHETVNLLLYNGAHTNQIYRNPIHFIEVNSRTINERDIIHRYARRDKINKKPKKAVKNSNSTQMTMIMNGLNTFLKTWSILNFI